MASGDALSGTKTIALVEQNGTRHSIGQLFIGDDGGYRIDWADAVFTDHFLSMRPFKCLEGSEKDWCHVPYPYPNRRQLTGNDLTDLEYDLLFLWRGTSEYGINMWNGVYYQLEQDGSALTGQLYELDMDLLSAPPADGELRPISDADLHEADPDSHWLPGLTIE